MNKPPLIHLNDDKKARTLVRTSQVEWVVTSQASGVARKMIERTGTERVARATTVVRFLPDQRFPRHEHSGGEEFLVLDGVWRDDFGAFPKYSYVRNYIGSGHTPHIGAEGCVILVKLRQMSTSTPEVPHHAHEPLNPSVLRKRGGCVQLFESALESVSVRLWNTHSTVHVRVPPGGVELFVVDGSFQSHLGLHDRWSWCRVPNECGVPLNFQVQTGDEEVYVWMKEGHLGSDEVGFEKP